MRAGPLCPRKRPTDDRVAVVLRYGPDAVVIGAEHNCPVTACPPAQNGRGVRELKPAEPEERRIDMKTKRVPMLRPAISALILLLALTACAGTIRDPSPPPSGIQGTAAEGPTCPVQRAGAPPCVRPYEGVIVVKQGDRVVTQGRSDARGRFKIALVPGRYTLTSAGGPPILKPVDVVVRPNAYTTIDLQFDTGIR